MADKLCKKGKKKKGKKDELRFECSKCSALAKKKKYLCEPGKSSRINPEK